MLAMIVADLRVVGEGRCEVAVDAVKWKSAGVKGEFGRGDAMIRGCA